jgi:hypothetical protein
MIQTYFNAEKKGGFWAMGIGIAACALGSGVLIKALPPFETGFAVPQILMGIVAIFGGAKVARNSDFQAYDLENLKQDAPLDFIAQETARMDGALKLFVRLKGLWLILLALGLLLAVLVSEPTFLKGLGCGLLLQATLFLVFDWMAEKRALKYVHFLKTESAALHN